MPRTMNDLSHHCWPAGKIGRLMTMAQIPVIAGDSFSIDLNGIFRFSPLRRPMALDGYIDFYGFYVPHRHIYSNWKDFIEQGVDETETLDTVASAHALEYLGFNGMTIAQEIPLHCVAGYNRIWNRYFRHPSDDASIRTDAQLENTTTDGIRYGAPIAYLKRLWNTGMSSINTPTGDDREVDVTANRFDIVDLKRVQARYKSELDREWFGQRYNDLLGKVWGSDVNIDADERPELLFRKSEWLSGYDVDGTDDATLGSFSGKGISSVNFQMPRKYFAEHGTIWIMASVRFPTVHEREVHYLVKKTQPSYKELAGDPTIIEAEEPLLMFTRDVFGDIAASNTDEIGLVPYAQWYREHPHFVHERFKAQLGLPFLRNTATGGTQYYHKAAEYDSAFQNEQLGHWNAQTTLTVGALRNLPPAIRSIYAGT